ncbi:hypothetical protein DPMN_110773 [Dreissena polymorpha]|uniref:Uncharacterized protein n=1 Tax=Dreissena polymorpha TaxID=45954 RepID=A0A9D4KDT3_DREPO|nr:hypothetical protein DPMN_110773 [Dreissena polymorpha]
MTGGRTDGRTTDGDLNSIERIDTGVCSYCRLPFPSAKDAVLNCAHEHPYEKVEPGESRQSPGTHRGYTGRAAATPRFNREQPGLHRESIQMFNTSGMNQELPGRTGNDRLGTGNNRACTGNNRDGTVRAPVY